MGGNALKNAVTRRYDKMEYHAMVLKVSKILDVLFPDCRHEPIIAYREKESFGDMDIIIESDNLPSNWQEELIEMFVLRPNQWTKNGNCFSFAYRQLQIDLIVTPSAEYQTSLDYFAYNDLGNLCGRIAHMMGLKLGHDGLSYNWRVDTYQFRNVVLLTDWDDILPVLGLDPTVYREGFDEREDIFRFVVSSPFFHKDIFLLENRNHTSRVRDAKRKTYTDFLKWIESYEETKDQQWHSNNRTREGYDKKEWLPYLFEAIPGFDTIYNEVQAEWEMEMEYKKRFNGDLVKHWTGLDGKELGMFMKYLREYGGSRFKVDIVKMNPHVVERYITYFYQKYTGTLPKMEINPLELEAVGKK